MLHATCVSHVTAELPRDWESQDMRTPQKSPVWQRGAGMSTTGSLARMCLTFCELKLNVLVLIPYQARFVIAETFYQCFRDPLPITGTVPLHLTYMF